MSKKIPWVNPKKGVKRGPENFWKYFSASVGRDKENEIIKKNHWTYTLKVLAKSGKEIEQNCPLGGNGRRGKQNANRKKVKTKFEQNPIAFLGWFI